MFLTPKTSLKILTFMALGLGLGSFFSLPSPSAKPRFTPYDLNPATFQQPPRSFGPYTRWWWPGNDVTNQELQREVVLFAENGFAGVEVQPSFEGLNPNVPADQRQRQLSWDTPSFYEHLRVVLEQARKSGLTIDLNAGSGWPIGGPQITPDSSILTLAYADTLVKGGQPVVMAVPTLRQERFTVSTRSAFQLNQTVSVAYAKLQAVMAGKVLKKNGKQTFLEPGSMQLLTGSVNGGKLSWQAPEGEWRVFSFWSMPDGELPKAIATAPTGFVADYLDFAKLKASYNHLFGPRTGLKPYFGNPLRAVFNDSYEFMPDRHYAPDFLPFFKQQRGYDITPYLPAIVKRYYNNAYIAPFTENQPFEFVTGDDDWRLRHDYDLTVSDLLQTQFIKPSNQWLNERGLLHRTQAYGARMDMIGASGAADMPEAEQLAGGNSEGFLKLVTAGAHLYNKPIITEEAFVFRGAAEMTTPQKIRRLADKSFAAGVNQLIYHGTPYAYQPDGYGKAGWNPFSNPCKPANNFSSAINERSPFWKDIRTINQYIARCQYLLQSGKPRADVLIYFPFNDFYPEQMLANPAETLVNGYVKGVEPDPAKPAAAEKLDGAKQWFAAVWPLVNQLEATGTTWEFVNDDALQHAFGQQGQISINGNMFQSLVLANLPYIPLATAEKVADLSKQGVRLLVYGETPTKQPSYLNFRKNDEKTVQFIQQALTGPNAKQIREEAGLSSWMTGLSLKLTFSQPYAFTRTTERQMPDGSRIRFIWNQSDQWQRVTLSKTSGYKLGYWLDAESGSISRHQAAASTYMLPPYGSIFLLATNKALPEKILSSAPAAGQKDTDVVKLETWSIQSGDAHVTGSPLFDWRSNDAFKHNSEPGVYTTSFRLNKEAGKQYRLDLGTVYFTADVLINGKSAGKKLWAPYQLDITSFLKTGVNSLQVRITPTYYNAFAGEAIKGNPIYAQFKRKEQPLMAAGLVGPVTIKVLR